MDNDKCYICHENDGVLRKTCNNEKCTAKTHSPCLQEQYTTLKKCGFCRSNIVIKQNPNHKTLSDFSLIILSFILYSFLISHFLIWLNILNPFDPFDSVANCIIFEIIKLVLINSIFYISSFLYKDSLLNKLNNKYGQSKIITWLSVCASIYMLICHFTVYILRYYGIGYTLIRILSEEKYKIYTYIIFFVGMAFSFYMPFSILLLIATYKYLLPPFLEQLLGQLLEPFCDEQFGE